MNNKDFERQSSGRKLTSSIQERLMAEIAGNRDLLKEGCFLSIHCNKLLSPSLHKILKLLGISGFKFNWTIIKYSIFKILQFNVLGFFFFCFVFVSLIFWPIIHLGVWGFTVATILMVPLIRKALSLCKGACVLTVLMAVCWGPQTLGIEGLWIAEWQQNIPHSTSKQRRWRTITMIFQRRSPWRK